MNHPQSRPRLALLAPFAILGLLASATHAAVLVDYKMTAPGDPLTGTTFAGPTALAANVSATALTNQSGGTFSGSQNYNGGTDRVSTWNTASGTSTVSYAGAFAAGNYVTFTVTAAADHVITLDSISFQAGAATANPAAKRSFYLVSETTAVAFAASSTVLASDSTPNAGAGGLTLPLQAATVNNSVPKDYSISLSSLAPIAGGQSRIFRFYLQTETSSQGLAFDDIVLNGTVSPIPEPSGFAALAGFASLALVTQRRRRHFTPAGNN